MDIASVISEVVKSEAVEKETKMSKLIDWTKEDAVLMTSSGIMHSYVKEEALSEHYIKVTQQWAPSIMSIDVVDDDYLLLRSYDPARGNAFYRVSDFKAIGKTPHFQHHWHSDKTIKGVSVEKIEIRMYKDRKASFIVYDTLGNIYITKKPQEINWRTEIEKESESIFVKIESETDIKRNSIKMNKKMANGIMGYWINSCSHEVSEKSSLVKYIAFSAYREFQEETCDKIREFFNLDDPENKFIVEQIDSAEYHSRSSAPRTLKGLFIIMTATNTAKKTAETKENHKDALLELFKEEWEKLEDYKNTTIWTRSGDEVVALVVGDDAYHNANIFSYNAKTQKRFIASYCKASWKTTDWTYPVASLKYLNDNMRLYGKKKYDYSTSCYVYEKAKTIIKGCKFEDLFIGTNVDWILSNADAYDIKLVPEERSGYRGYKKSSPDSVKDQINKDHIGQITLNILATSGIAIAEQLLKSCCFNMYFMLLSNMEVQGDTFIDTSTKKEVRRFYNRILYNGKEKNLKKMLGLPMNFIRLIDAACALETTALESSGRKTEYSFNRTIPNVQTLKSVLGEEVGSVDTDTALKYLKAFKSYNGDGDNIANIRNKMFPGIKAKQLIQELVAYGIIKPDGKSDYGQRQCLEWANDYCNMRAQLQIIKDEHPEAISMKAFPIRPQKGCCKFIRYIPGMDMTGCYTWRYSGFKEPERFVNFYKDVYEKAFKEGRAEMVYDGFTLAGFIIQMDLRDHLRYLHDQAMYWTRFYSYGSRGEDEFTEAIKRVKPLEWRDPKLGLEIIAPEKVVDVINEGAVLNHCVASYVDPIIKGTENIVFLRRDDMPGAPFFTVEVLGGEVKQVHCYANGGVTEEEQEKAFKNSGLPVYEKKFDVIKFLKNWTKAVGLKGIGAGALCTADEEFR